MRIVRVDAMESDVLDIELSNGNTLLLKIEAVLGLPGFAKLNEDDRILYPHTDGKSIYWRGGQRLSVEDIRRLAFANGDNNG